MGTGQTDLSRYTRCLQHVHAQQQTTDAWDVFTDSLAIKEDPCTVAAGPIFDTDTMPRLTPAERERAVGLLTAGEDPRAVAVAFNVHLATIYRLQQRFTATGVTDDRPRTGRPRVTTQRQDCHIFRHHVRDRFQTANETGRNTLGNHQRLISGQTVRRRLAERDLENRRPARVLVLTRRHRLARLQWARNHANWNWRQWRTILFTDESRYCVSHVDGRVRVWRRRGERYADDCVMQNNAWGGPSVMLWGGIGLNQLLGPVFFRGLGPGRGNGVTAQRYINQILRPHVVPFFQAHGNCEVWRTCCVSCCLAGRFGRTKG